MVYDMVDLTFPAPNATEATNIVSLMQYINNDLVSGMFGITILIAIFFIAFISMKKYETEIAFSTSMFFTAIVSYLLFVLELIGESIIISTTLITALSVFFLYRRKG